jgi:eukaryotic-like serine/threonine-protein kinase
MSLVPDPILTLAGRDIGNGWIVERLVKAGPVASGGHFSICYLARKPDGTEGFMKAFDFRLALREPDVMRALQELTTSYNFERDLLALCKERNIKRIVTAMDSGTIDIPGVPLDRVFYIIFELADGDARQQIDTLKRRNFVWIYKALHNISTALRSMHNNGIYHQDLKPSNVLVFSGGSENKVSDLGRSHCDLIHSPNGNLSIPGFIAYAPPEQLYGYELSNSHQRRAAADLYQIGSLLLFFFTGVMVTPALTATLAPEHRPLGRSGWGGSFEGVLPYLDNAFASVAKLLEDALMEQIPPSSHERFIPATMGLFRMLAAVRPEDRGHPQTAKNVRGLKYDLERIISEFDSLAKKAVLIDRHNAKAA